MRGFPAKNSSPPVAHTPRVSGMDMEMDIPLPEELEWLEANSHHSDDFDDLEPPPEEPYPEEDQEIPEIRTQSLQPSKPTLPIPPTPAPDVDTCHLPPSRFIPKKRSASDPAVADSLDEKRSRIGVIGTEIDEDWILLSPPPTNNEAAVAEEKFISRFASEIDGDCMPVTASGGDRVYAKINRVEKQALLKINVKGPCKGLIAQSLNDLMERVERSQFQKALRVSVESLSDAFLPGVPAVNEQLWVDKYTPKSFMELLSDEQTNREVLLWIKQWDSCVFGSEIKSTTEDVLSSLKRYTSTGQHPKASVRSYFERSRESRFCKETLEFNDFGQENAHELLNKKSKGSGPPEQKVLLLCGPPGLGKTTLAHVAARHCGYRVVEINASDDRASSTIEAKILDVVQMNSVMSDSKPKCLVIDEIDGALDDGKGAVDVILKMVSAERRMNFGKENGSIVDQLGKNSSKKKSKGASLSRPVICICNDLYAPALRPLRQVAKVHVFVRPTISRIVSRLKYICNKEGMKTGSVALAALAEYTECDIRSCLNTLQFLNKKKEILNVSDINSQVVGQKDKLQSVFDVWNQIFQKRRPMRERISASGCRSGLSGYEFLYSLLSNRGDYELVLDGIHENILQLQYHDPTMHKTVKCLQDIGVSDLVHQYIMRTQRWFLQVYQPAVAIAVHKPIAQLDKPRIEWPKSFQRYRTTLTEKLEILRSWQNQISPYISRHLSTKSFVEDSISPLLHILSPPTLRPVALHLLSEKEKTDLYQLVGTMVLYSVTYKNSVSLPGTRRNEAAIDPTVLSFDPPIDEFVKFKDYQSSYFILASAARQILSHEVEKRRIVQAGINKSIKVLDVDADNKKKRLLVESGSGREQSTRSDSHVTTVGRKSSTTNPSISGRSATANEKLTAQKHSRGSSNFFERFRKVSADGSQVTNSSIQASVTKERDSRPLIFKFNEGFTNAVKRPVRIREFLQ